ncbi:HD domain-containing protein 2 [Glycine soja]
MVIIHYSAASCCCVPSLHRSSPSRSILAPAIFFFRDAAPNLRLVSVWSQPPGSEGFGEPNKHSSRDASVGFSASSSSVIDFLTLCHRLKTTKRKGWVNHGIKGAESIADHMYRMALMALVSGDVPGLDRESFPANGGGYGRGQNRGRGAQGRGGQVQCQIYKKRGHEASTCYHRSAVAPFGNFGSPYSFFGPSFSGPSFSQIGPYGFLLQHSFAPPNFGAPQFFGNMQQPHFANGTTPTPWMPYLPGPHFQNPAPPFGDITPSDGVPKAEKSRMEQEALSKMCELLGGGIRAEEIKELWAEYENNSSLEANLVKDFDKVEMILQALEYETEHGKVLDEFFLSTAGKFQTEIGKSWAAEIISRRKSLSAKRPLNGTDKAFQFNLDYTG